MSQSRLIVAGQIEEVIVLALTCESLPYRKLTLDGNTKLHYNATTKPVK